MQIVFFSSNINMIDEWRKAHDFEYSLSCSDLDSFNQEIEQLEEFILIADYDSVSHDINSLISSNQLPKSVIVLEKSPAIATGKMLINSGVKAYGNSRMFTTHYIQMLQTVLEDKIWTYPELTSALVKSSSKVSLNENAKDLISSRLTPKEIEVTYLVLQGLTNNAIATELEITTRTVKAHMSAIFSKLHINDRVSLVLLLK